MSVVIRKSVDIELLIEGYRDSIFQKITRQPLFPVHTSSDTINSSGEASETIQGSFDLSQTCTQKEPTDPIPSKHVKMTPIYRVQESHLSNQERIFKVGFYSSEYHYYAFEFKGYIVCPAFLAASFELTKFACLNVVIGSGLGFCYIFVKVGPDDHVSKILGDHSDFFKGREYDFTMPSEKHKVVELNFENKGINCFLDYDKMAKDHPFRKEWNMLGSSSYITPQKSLVDLSYVFLPKIIVNDFAIRHKEFFNKDDFCIFETSFVRIDSKSYLEIIELESGVYSDKEESELIIQSLDDIFTNTVYKREEYILESLVTHIKDNYQVSKEQKLKKFYCSMIAILQSSGYGKSKLMERLGSRTPTFYSSLQYGAGFPRESFFLSKLLKELDDIQKLGLRDNKIYHMNNFSTAVYIYILRIIYIIAKNNDYKPLDKNFQIDDIKSFELFSKNSDDNETIFKTLFKNLKRLCENENPVNFDGLQTLELKDIDTFQDISLNVFTVNSHSTNDLEGEVASMLTRMSVINSRLPSVFVIDEAKGLRYKKTDTGEEKYTWRFQDQNVKTKRFVNIYERAPYNVFRRTFRMFKNPWELIILIIISTSGQISVLLPELDLDPSRRETTSLNFINNFVFVRTYNVNSEDAASIRAGMFPNENIENWIEFLDSSFRIEEFFKIGRPLIYGTFVNDVKSDLIAKKYDLEATLDDCKEFSFLSLKLFGGKKYQQTKNIAILSAMFNFAFGVNFLPPQVKKEELVENYLMTLVKYFDENGHCYLAGCYLPEGAFNALSSMYFVQNPDSLYNLLSESIKYGLCDVGNLGELLAQYILIKTAFTCIDQSVQKIRKLIFQPIPLRKFLKLLVGKEDKAVVEFFYENPELDGSFLSFSYFEPFPKKPMTFPFDLMARCLFKGSAITLNSNFVGIDLMIPLVLKNGQVSFLGIQVKFVQPRGVTAQIRAAVDHMIFTKMFNAKNDDDRPFGLMILALGDYKYIVGKDGDYKICADKDIEYKYLNTYVKKRPKKSMKNAPSILILEGTPDLFNSQKRFFRMAPESFSCAYRGINPDYFKVCDRMDDLTTDEPLSKKEELEPNAKRFKCDLEVGMKELNL